MRKHSRSKIYKAANALLLAAVALSSIFMFSGRAHACSNGYFSVDGKIMIGRNMDWPKPDGYVVINERGVSRHSILVPRKEAAQWTSRYGCVTFNLTEYASGIGFMSVPGGGINEKGLYIGSLWAPASKYDARSDTDKRKEVSAAEVVSFILGQYATVDEALAGLKSVHVRDFNTGSFDVNLHWFIADGSGRTACVEYRNGKREIYQNPDHP
jgi:choloylglycine hydrolase